MAITAATYKAKASGKVVLGTSSNKGTPFIEYYYQITAGENAGGQVRWTGYFSEKTQERTIQALQTSGWDGDDLSDFADGGLHGLDKNDVDIVVEMEEYETPNGDRRVSPRVAWVNRGGGYLNIENAMNEDAAKAFGEKMRGLVLQAKSKQPVKGTGTEFKFGANAPPIAATPNGTKAF